MPIPGTVPVTSKIAPTDPADTYPTHEDSYGKGGFRPVPDDAARDAITAERRSAGMIVYVRGTGKWYVLSDDLTTWVQIFQTTVTPPPTPPPTPTIVTLELDTVNLSGILDQQVVGGYTSNFQSTGWEVKALELYYNRRTPAEPDSKIFARRYVKGTDFNIGDVISYRTLIPTTPVAVIWVAIVYAEANPSVEYEIPLVPTLTEALGANPPSIVPYIIDIGVVSAIDADNGARYAFAEDIALNKIYLRRPSAIYVPTGATKAKATVDAAVFELPVPYEEYPAVTDVYFKRRVEYAPKGDRDTRIASRIYLKLASPLEQGRLLTVTTPGDTNILRADENWSTIITDNRFAETLHVNQYGYQVGHRKVGMVGLYLGATGRRPLTTYPNAPISAELSVADFGEFQIVRADNHQVVFSGALKPRPDLFWQTTDSADPTTDGKPIFNQQVKVADFTAFDTPGYYKLKVPGLGCSFPFYINDKVFLGMLRFMLKGIYQARCGEALDIPYTRQSHDPCHTKPVVIPSPDGEYETTWQLIAAAGDIPPSWQEADVPYNEELLVIPYTDKGLKTIVGGHHDAGDFGRYTFSVAFTVAHLVLAADLWVGDYDNLGIPESGNNCCDLLDEAKVDADFLLQMQDSDGHFYTLLRPLTRAYDDDQPLRGSKTGDQMAAYPKSTVATASAVAALAKIGGSPKFRQQFGDAAADVYLNAAIAGWNALQALFTSKGKKASFQKIWHYGSTWASHDDELAWAAIELYLATGVESYHDWVLNTPCDITGLPWDPMNKAVFWRWNWWPIVECSGTAVHAYLTAQKSGRITAHPTISLNSVLLSKCTTAALEAADYRLANVEGSCFGDGLPRDYKRNIDAAWYVSGWHNFDLAIGWEVQTDPAKKQRYINAFAECLGATFGCNAVNTSFLSNVGLRSYRDIVHQMFQYDKANRKLPPTGWSTGELNKRPSYAGLVGTYKGEVAKLLFPNLNTPGSKNDHPLRERYVDQFDILRETTVWEGAVACAGAAWLAHLVAGNEAQAFVPVAGVIVGVPDDCLQNDPLAATLTAPGISTTEMDEARIHWEHEKIEEPFQGGPTTEYINGKTLVYSASISGPTRLEGEAHLKDGRIIVARKFYTARAVANRDIRDFINPANPDIKAWWKFDTDLADTYGNGILVPVLGSNVARDNASFTYPLNPGGGSLRSYFELGNRASVIIPYSVVLDLAVPGIGFSVEFMMYVEYWMFQILAGNHYAFIFGNSYSKRLVIWDQQYRAGRAIQGNSGNPLCAGSEFDSAFLLNTWNHVKFETTTTGQRVLVNGVQVGSGYTANALNAWTANTQSITLDIGDFQGWIDDVVVTIMR